MSTINSVQQSLDTFRKAFDAHVIEDQEVYKRTAEIQTLLSDRTAMIQSIQDRVKHMDDRLTTQEADTKANTVLFQENKQLLEDVKKVVKGVRVVVYVIGTAILGAIATNAVNYFWHLVHP